MIEYELLYLVAESKEVDLARIKEEVKAIVEANGGTYTGAEKLEKRKLAYAIKREIRGTYIAQRFTTADRNKREASIEAGEASIVTTISRLITLYRDVLRFIIVRAEDLPSLTPVVEDDATKIVEEVVQEAHIRAKNTEKKTTPKVKEVKEEAVVKKDEIADAKATQSEEELDKKLDDVLKI